MTPRSHTRLRASSKCSSKLDGAVVLSPMVNIMNRTSDIASGLDPADRAAQTCRTRLR